MIYIYLDPLNSFWVFDFGEGLAFSGFSLVDT
jgi:hypothetical protein